MSKYPCTGGCGTTSMFRFGKDQFTCVNCKRLSHIRPEIRLWVENLKLTNTRITCEQWDEWFKAGGMNSWEREYLLSHASTELLVRTIKQSLENCRPKLGSESIPCSTYDEAIIHFFMPLMIERLSQEPAATIRGDLLS